MNTDKPWLLAFDLSTPRGALVVDGPGITLCGEVDASSRASQLFVLAGDLISEAGICLRDIALFGVGRGPGSFTGVRVAVTAAKLLASVLAIPLVAPDSLMVTAAGSGEDEDLVFAAIDARRGEVYHAFYRMCGGFPEALMDPCVAPPESAADSLRGWMEKLDRGVIGVGNGIAAYPDAWPEGMKVAGTDAPRAESLAELCRLAYKRGETVDPVALLPLYLRRPDARERCGGGGG